MSLCHLPATHVITYVWPAVFHTRTNALASRQALITPGTSEVDSTVPRGPVSHRRGLVRPHPALHVASCASPPSSKLPCAVCAGLFSSSYDPTSLLICPLASPLQCLGSPRYSIPTQHSFPLRPQLTCAPIALSILCRTAFFTDLWVD